jgi:hypothetical protein
MPPASATRKDGSGVRWNQVARAAFAEAMEEAMSNTKRWMIAGAAAGLLVHGAPRAADNPEPTQQQPEATEGTQQGDVRTPGTGTSAQDAGAPNPRSPEPGGPGVADPSAAQPGSGDGGAKLPSAGERATENDAAGVEAGNTGGRG